MLDDKAPKIYGFDTIDKKLPVYVVEGPFDEALLNNSEALCGADGDIRCLEGSDLVFVYDNEAPAIEKLSVELENVLRETRESSSGKRHQRKRHK